MPSNEEHVAGAKPIAVVASIAVAGGIYWYTGQLWLIILGAIPMLSYPVLVGIPDIDSESSIPRRHLRKALITGIPLALIYVLITNRAVVTGWLIGQFAAITPDNAIVTASIGTLIGGFGIAIVADNLASDLLPNHRGPLHHPAFYLLLGVPLIALLHEWYLVYQPAFVRYGVLIFLGSAILFALVHIGQDKVH